MTSGGLSYFLPRLSRFFLARIYASLLHHERSCPPLTLHIEATNHCNLNCAMCFQQTMERKKGEIEFDLFKEIIDQAAGWVSHLQIANFGEPLLHPRIEEMIRYAAERGFFVELFTNGLQLDDDRCEMLVRSGTGKVNVSIDALNAETYKLLRGTDLQPVLDNLKGLSITRKRLNSHAPFIVIAAADLAANPGQPKSIQERARILGADSWYVTPSMNWAGMVEGAPTIKPKGADYAGCLFPWYLVNVSYEGIVTPCCIDAELRNQVGDISKQNLRDIWNGPQIRKLRRSLVGRDIVTLSEISACHKCSRLFYSQEKYTANRARIELAQLAHPWGRS